jgi:hypothetical protein
VDIGKKVREEKKEYELKVTDDAEVTREELEKKDNLIPLDQTGKVYIDRLVKEYFPEQTCHLQIPEDRIPHLVTALRKLNKNLIKFAGPMTCKGPKCAMGGRCPLQVSTIAPIGHPCSIELMLVDQWEKEYIDDLSVDRQSKVELDMVRDMIEADLIDWRTSQDISENGLFDWNAVGVTGDGKPIYRKEEAASLSIKLKFKARKDRLREDLMATRKMKAKFGLNKTIDPSKLASSLQDRYRKIKEAEIVEETTEMDKGTMELDK